MVVMGGGFGGLYTAVRLSSLFWQRNKMPQVRVRRVPAWRVAPSMRPHAPRARRLGKRRLRSARPGAPARPTHPLPAQITLVDKSDRFVFKPLLYELLNGGADEAEVAPPFLQLLAPYPVRYVQVSAGPPLLAGCAPRRLAWGRDGRERAVGWPCSHSALRLRAAAGPRG